MTRFFTAFIFSLLCAPLIAQTLDNNSFRLVNSSYDEQDPVISPDGKTLFFTMANHPLNVGGKKDPGDIWISRLIGNEWSAPIHAGALLNDRAYNAVAGLSVDGAQLFLHGHYDASGNVARTQGISVSRNTGSGWSQPENISIPFFQNKSGLLSGYVTPDKGVLIFSAETYGSFGVEDIYVSLNEDGRWTEPRNLGTVINTQFQEICPTLSANGRTIYFSSNGRKGKGSFDVYFSNRLDNTWTNWSVPVNVSANINSEGRELFYRTYPDLGFAIFTSTKSSDGYGDIRLFRPDEPFAKDTSTVLVKNTPDTVVKFVEINHDKTDDKLIKVYGKVTNVKTGEPIVATVNFSAPAVSTDLSATVSEGFSIRIPSTDVYTIRIEANGYVSAIEKLDIHTYEMKELEMNFKLQPVEVGTRVNLKNVLFERGTSNLLPESNPELDLVVSFLKANPAIKIELAGHTDNRGVHGDNVKLSQERVNRVKEYLVSNGIESKRITGKGYGGMKPIASNDNEETRKLNRRVEFIIKKF